MTSIAEGSMASPVRRIHGIAVGGIMASPSGGSMAWPSGVHSGIAVRRIHAHRQADSWHRRQADSWHRRQADSWHRRQADHGIAVRRIHGSSHRRGSGFSRLITMPPPLKREMLPVDWDTTTARLAVICESAAAAACRAPRPGGRLGASFSGRGMCPPT